MTITRRHYTPTFKAEVIQEVLQEEQTLNQIAFKHGIHPNLVRRWCEAAVTAMPEAFDEEERVAMVERGPDVPLPLTCQTKLLGLSRARLYYQPVAVSPEELRLKHRIDEIYTEWPF